jgi:hypothetical protein
MSPVNAAFEKLLEYELRALDEATAGEGASGGELEPGKAKAGEKAQFTSAK